ncbi:MAG: alkaline phosphatase family protein [Bacillota bacterium]|jgi:hypothetical protein
MKRIMAVVALVAMLGIGYWLGQSHGIRKGANLPSTALTIVGDVATTVWVESLQGMQRELETVTLEKGSIQAIPLQSLVQLAEPLADKNKVVLRGVDGVAAELSQLEGAYITYSAEHGWHAKNPNHPVSSNIKHLQDIIVVAEGFSWDRGINIMTSEENLDNFTVGQLLNDELSLVRIVDGTATVEHEGQRISSSAVVFKRMLGLGQLLERVELPEPENLAVMGENGAFVMVDMSMGGYLEVGEHSVNYVVLGDYSQTVRDVRAMMFNAPELSIMQTFDDTVRRLENGEKVMIAFLDGLSYRQYRRAVETGMAPYLQSLPPAEKALSIYQPVTNAGFAAMITGQPPGVNGVHSRSQRGLNVPSIFGRAVELGQKAILVEGNIQILDTEVDPRLNLDQNQQHGTDDEVFASGLQAIAEQPDLLMVHFHGIDDCGHQFGPLAEQTLQKIQQVDSYLQALAAEWDGTIIVVADHGMHVEGDGGSHGQARAEDFVVPYIVR